MFKEFLIVFFVALMTFVLHGQNSEVRSKQLTEFEIDSVFTDSLKMRLQINYPIYRVYGYNDKLGEHLIVMTEESTSCTQREECFKTIKGFCFYVKNDEYKLKWSLKDFILPRGNEVSEEYSISFWTKYFKLGDFDNDGIVDPIVVYGTFGMNETNDGRIKILIYNKNKKRVIRHQNGVLDFQRSTQVDKSFYELPTEIQNRVKEIMRNITENGHGIFPAGWQKAMENKELTFDEN